MSEPWLSADDIAAQLGIAKDTVCAWTAGKPMPGRRVGRLRRSHVSEIDESVRSGGASRPPLNGEEGKT